MHFRYFLTCHVPSWLIKKILMYVKVIVCWYDSSFPHIKEVIGSHCFQKWMNSFCTQTANLTWVSDFSSSLLTPLSFTTYSAYSVALNGPTKVCNPEITHVWISFPCSHPKIAATWTITPPPDLSIQPLDSLFPRILHKNLRNHWNVNYSAGKRKRAVGVFFSFLLSQALSWL